MISTATSPGETASSHGVQLVEEGALGRLICLNIGFAEEIREIFDVVAYIQVLSFREGRHDSSQGVPTLNSFTAYIYASAFIFPRFW